MANSDGAPGIIAAASWSAPVLWRFAWLRGKTPKSGGGPPHSKTLPRKT